MVSVVADLEKAKVFILVVIMQNLQLRKGTLEIYYILNTLKQV